MKVSLDEAGVIEQDAALRTAAGEAFYNTSKLSMRDLKSRANRHQLKADLEAYLDGFSPNVQDILENFEFRNQIPRLSKADSLGTLIEHAEDPEYSLVTCSSDGQGLEGHLDFSSLPMHNSPRLEQNS
jgi:type I restriction enzyme M protein